MAQEEIRYWVWSLVLKKEKNKKEGREGASEINVLDILFKKSIYDGDSVNNVQNKSNQIVTTNPPLYNEYSLIKNF
jgi:hypothetical protein